jgi:hypothetical protein
MKRNYFFIFILIFFGFVKEGLIVRVDNAVLMKKSTLRREEMLQEAEVRLSLSLSLSLSLYKDKQLTHDLSCISCFNNKCNFYKNHSGKPLVLC